MEFELRCSICNCLKSETPKFYKNSVYGKNLCNKHYIQLSRYGEIRDDVKRITLKDKVCVVCGDDYDMRGYGGNDVDDKYIGVPLCQYHYGQIINFKEIKDTNKSPSRQERKCCVCKKSEQVTRIIYYKEENKMYCLRHYSQIKKLGGLKERTKFEVNLFNKIIVDGDEVVEIILEDKSCQELVRTIVDVDDYEKYFKNVRLGFDNNGYAILSKKYIQKIIMNTNKLVDHVNLNKLDNRKCNLRIADRSKNAMNCDIKNSNKSGFTGVSWSKNSNRWRAYISFDKKRLELGFYDDIKQAVEERIKNEFKHFKEFRHKHNEENYIVKYGVEEWNKFILSLKVGGGYY